MPICIKGTIALEKGAFWVLPHTGYYSGNYYRADIQDHIGKLLFYLETILLVGSQLIITDYLY